MSYERRIETAVTHRLAVPISQVLSLLEADGADLGEDLGRINLTLTDRSIVLKWRVDSRIQERAPEGETER